MQVLPVFRMNKEAKAEMEWPRLLTYITGRVDQETCAPPAGGTGADYFKGLVEETRLPYQKLIDLYLLDCAKKRKKLAIKWVA